MGNKHIYLIRGKDQESYDEFVNRILELGNSISKKFQPEYLKVTLTHQKPPNMAVIPFKKKKIAAISIVSSKEDPVEEMVAYEGFNGAFVVEEVVPVGYEKTWMDGEQTPGIGLLTLFHKKKGIDHPTFLNRWWHNSHTPLSLKIHPLWNYNRNVVRGKLTDHEHWFDGIVEEHFRERRDLLNIFRFFGKPHQVIPRMIHVYTDTNSFLDYKRIEPYFVTEFILVS